MAGGGEPPSWFDVLGNLLCDAPLDDDAIRRGVAVAFGLAPGDIAVAGTVGEIEGGPPFVVRWASRGDLVCSTEVYLADEPTERRSAVLRRFAVAVGCRVVTDTELDVEVDPMGWTLAEPNGEIRRVTLLVDDDDVTRLEG